jgi:predicted enzyme related to lactoylglutathione lyase
MSSNVKLQNVYLATPDMGASRSFFERLLDIRPTFADGKRWTQYRLGVHNFSLSALSEAAGPATGTTIVFEVTDLGPIETMAVSLGGSVIGRRDMGSHGRIATIADPTGGIVQFLERAERDSSK